LRSTRSSSRARTSSQRGVALIAAIFLAILYFGLIELMLIDSARELQEAQRFRARIVALTLAENGAELAARDLVNTTGGSATLDDWQGSARGTLLRGGAFPLESAVPLPPGIIPFELQGSGESTGVVKVKASVRVYGEIEGRRIRINYSMHSQ
jgi:hypothetical protein